MSNKGVREGMKNGWTGKIEQSRDYRKGAKKATQLRGFSPNAVLEKRQHFGTRGKSASSSEINKKVGLWEDGLKPKDSRKPPGGDTATGGLGKKQVSSEGVRDARKATTGGGETCRLATVGRGGFSSGRPTREEKSSTREKKKRGRKGVLHQKKKGGMHGEK